MEKILLTGKLNDIARSLNECLLGDYFVQLCSEQPENVQALVKITKPDLIIVCQIGTPETSPALFEWFRKNIPDTPVLVIATAEEWRQCEELYKDRSFDILLRPVTRAALLERCRRLLGKQWTPAGHENAQKLPAQKKKIMLVDDSALLLRSMKTMLEKYYHVCLARSGEQALTRIPKEQPDLVLLDYEMEGMDGRAVFEAMKKDDTMRSIPVVFLTSVSNRQSIYSVLKSIPQGYILKPPDETRIRETIEEILGEHSRL